MRAPRLWYDKAARDLCQVGFARPLDRCVFMSFNGGDLPKSVNEGMERLDGILGLHVDDFIGGGEGMNRVAVEGWNHVPAGEQNFASRVKWLKTKLELGSLHLGLSFPFTGIQLTQSPNFECIQLSLENYLQKVKPIALSKERRQNPHAETTAQEKHQLRGLNGSMNWPVTQMMLYGAASLSIQAANVGKSIVEDVHEANKTLRFLKANAAVGLTYVRLGALPELLLGTYFDGSWATRRDGTSQGGYLQFAVTRSAAETGGPVPLIVTDWTSKKVNLEGHVVMLVLAVFLSSFWVWGLSLASLALALVWQSVRLLWKLGEVLQVPLRFLGTFSRGRVLLGGHPLWRSASTGAGSAALGRPSLAHGCGDCWWCHDEAH